MAVEKIKKIYRRIYGLGGTWGDFRDDYLRPARTDAPERLLDAGCGQGHLKDDFKRFGRSIEYFGVDLTVGDANWTFRLDAVADLQALPFRKNCFDKIISIEVLEHVELPEVVFGELSRVLSPGGSLFLALPFVWHLHQEPHDHHRFSKFAIQSMAARHGLEVNQLRPMGGYFSVLRYLFSNYSFIAERGDPTSKTFARIINLPLKWLDVFLVAPLCFVLDFLDREKKLTLGYHVHLKKKGVLPTKDLSSPFVCPKCRFQDDASLEIHTATWTCNACNASYPVVDGVPRLLIGSQNLQEKLQSKVLSNNLDHAESL